MYKTLMWAGYFTIFISNMVEPKILTSVGFILLSIGFIKADWEF
jgi:hypothetical protein